jgi:uncharacterized protein (TIGR04255 family)
MFNLPDDHHNFWHRMRAAPLARAVADLEFPFLPELSSSEALIRLRDAVVADFNLDRGSRSDAVSIADAGEPDDGANARYAFRSKDGYELLITSTNIALSQAGEHYADGENFARVFERVVAAFRSVFEAPRYTRLGVRYVNAAPATVEEWVAWFKPQFTGFIGDAVLPPESHRGALQIVQVQDSATEGNRTRDHEPRRIGDAFLSRRHRPRI